MTHLPRPAQDHDLLARVVGITEEDGVLTVGLVEGLDGEGWRLLLMRADVVGEQHRALGMGTRCIVTGDQEPVYSLVTP